MFTNLQLEEMKAEYKQLLSSVQRPGIENLIEWLDKCDFYEAPSSTKYHNNCKGGLLAHSLNVYKAAVKIRDNMKDIALPEKNIGSISDETLIVAALLHDLCKINYYVPAIKTWKDENAPYGNQWKKYIAYDINDTFPLGHGEKSVLIAQQFIRLTGEEILAIRWHMGPWNVAPNEMNDLQAANENTQATERIPKIKRFITTSPFLVTYYSL